MNSVWKELIDKFELNEKGILGEKKETVAETESSVGIEFQMSGAWINEFLLHWFDTNVECIL